MGHGRAANRVGALTLVNFLAFSRSRPERSCSACALADTRPIPRTPDAVDPDLTLPRRTGADRKTGQVILEIVGVALGPKAPQVGIARGSASHGARRRRSRFPDPENGAAASTRSDRGCSPSPSAARSWPGPTARTPGPVHAIAPVRFASATAMAARCKRAGASPTPAARCPAARAYPGSDCRLAPTSTAAVPEYPSERSPRARAGCRRFDAATAEATE